jgi:Na+/H+ antiporter NhaD/arsenite permease-like protein
VLSHKQLLILVAALVVTIVVVVVVVVRRFQSSLKQLFQVLKMLLDGYIELQKLLEVVLVVERVLLKLVLESLVVD